MYRQQMMQISQRLLRKHLRQQRKQKILLQNRRQKNRLLRNPTEQPATEDAASELSAEDIFHVLSGTSPHSSEYDALTNQSIEEISEIFDASEEQAKAAKASDVEMEWSADKMQQFLNGEGIDQDADHSAESQQS